MRKWLLLLCVLAQPVALLTMAAERELIIRKGRSVYLQTSPIDPRDVFRGDFVRLRYDINTLPLSLYSGSAAEARKLKLEKGQRIYASLEQDSAGVYHMHSWSTSRPGQGVFLQGRISTLRNRWFGSNAYRARYGIEQYFVEQGTGLEIEARRGKPGELQIPMQVRLGVNRKGKAVVHDYRWSAMGIGLETARREAVAATQDGEDADSTAAQPQSPLLRITLQNVSGQPLALHDPGEHCSFSLIPVATAGTDIVTANHRCDNSDKLSDGLVVLQPGEQHRVELDLSLPRWYMQVTSDAGKTTVGEIAGLDGSRQYRVVYSPPAASQAAQADSAVTVWQGRLSTQAFNARGNID